MAHQRGPHGGAHCPQQIQRDAADTVGAGATWCNCLKFWGCCGCACKQVPCCADCWASYALAKGYLSQEERAVLAGPPLEQPLAGQAKTGYNT